MVTTHLNRNATINKFGKMNDLEIMGRKLMIEL